MENANILVVEDDDNVALTIERCLRRENYKVTLASSGVQGLQLARRRIPDLVLLDIVMPGMDGFTVCKEMRSDPVLSEVPIIFLTARSKEDDRIAGFLAGGDDYLGKPFNLDELTLRIRAVLRRTKITANNIPLQAVETQHSSKPVINITTPAVKEVKIKGYVLNVRTFELTTPKGLKILLTPVQYDLLFHRNSTSDEFCHHFHPGGVMVVVERT